jgi:hypothetical protein
MNAALDMHAETTKLANRIVEPVADRFDRKELDIVVGKIAHTFQYFSNKSSTANVDFKDMAVNILEPLRLVLSKADFLRIVDRFRGAMVRFCQADEYKAKPELEPRQRDQAAKPEPRKTECAT